MMRTLFKKSLDTRLFRINNKQRIEQVRKRGLPPPLLGWTSGGKPLFLTCFIYG